MSRRLEPPVVTVTPNHAYGDSVSKHPAFGCVVVTQWHSSKAQRLFGSDLGHHVGVTLKFHAAEQMRGLSQDRHHPRQSVSGRAGLRPGKVGGVVEDPGDPAHP